MFFPIANNFKFQIKTFQKTPLCFWGTFSAASPVPAHRQCSTYFKRGWDIICGSARDRPLRSAEDGVAIFKIFKIRVELMYRHCSLLEVQKTLGKWSLPVFSSEWSYGVEATGQPFRASSQSAPSLQHHPYRGRSLPMTKIALHKIARSA